MVIRTKPGVYAEFPIVDDKTASFVHGFVAMKILLPMNYKLLMMVKLHVTGSTNMKMASLI